MAKYQIVVDDPAVEQSRRVERYTAGVRAQFDRVPVAGESDQMRAARWRSVERELLKKHGQLRPSGFVHDRGLNQEGVESDCPFELPNCRNCGDPDHATECRAAGHCPDCGTKHGIAPDAVVTRNGYRLEPR